MGRRAVVGAGAAVAVLAAAGGIAVLSWPDDPVPVSLPATVPSAPPASASAGAPGTGTGTSPVKAPAVSTAVNRIALASASLPQRATKRFSMVSVSWQNPADEPAGTVQVRTRSARTGAWSGWKSLAVAEDAADKGEQAGVRGRTEPLWAGPSNGVAARLAGAGAGAKALPAGLRLTLIDPDAPVTTGGAGGGMLAEPTTPAPEGPAGAPPALSPGATAPAQLTPSSATRSPAPSATPRPIEKPMESGKLAVLPKMVTRAQWGADEKLVKAPATVAAEGVKMIWVHHGGFANPEPCSATPSILRAIMTQDLEDGFDDIGYNFVVDKCGTLYEGRKGSATAAVVGAHVAGFNTGSAGIALLGDFTTVRPTQAALTTVAQVAAARLGAYGFDPVSTAEMTAGVTGLKWPLGTKVTFPRIAGHRDGAETECPGDLLYPLLGVVRARAVLPGLKITKLTGGPLVGATGTYYVRRTARLFWDVTGDLARVARYDVLLDGKVSRTVDGNAERAATVDVPAGAHTLAVRVVHASGVADVTPSIKVYGDVTAPVFPAAPAVTLRTGTSSATAVPVTVTFRSTDNVKVFSQRATSPAAVALGAASTVWYPTAKPNTAVKYAVEARDWAGNVGTGAVTRTVTQLPETSAKRTGAWSARAASTYLGGRALAASAKNAKLAYTFTGRSAALTFTRAASTGVAYVYVDGVKVATVDTKAARTTHRQTLWVRALTAKAHTVSVVVAGTAGRPTVISDGLAYVG
ncbi:N-acetylmuramoyl-L-alanine amidase [Actinoplanes sp. URMC 104]|uniref:N-acetylmuramoyl-L-alanine amidase n=1 Tax=Actinoplanes sp. URMC 104 TaxID=3423409 RepID=UPI003F1C8049